MADAMPDDMWTPFKQLHRSVETYLSKRAPEGSLSNLELILHKHKPDFVNLLKNSPKNSTCREEIQKGITDGVNLPGLGHTILSKDLVDESIILSDMFDLNEYKALELLCTAQQQIPHHPGLPRGLVAILLYYDGRKTLVTTLKQLFQARHGISWCTDAPPDITTFITNYTDALVADGILNRIIDLLEQLDLTQELTLLSENRALGPPKHHRQVLDFFEEIRVQLATTLYCWAAQSGLPRNTTLKLIQYLSKYTSDDPRGGIDDVTLALIMALVYAFDLSVLKKRDDGEDTVLQMPIVSDSAYIKDVYSALTTDWKSNELRSVGLFAFALTIATLRQAPQNLQQNASELIDQHEILAETAIQDKVFDYIYHVVLEKSSIFRTEFYFRRIHFLLTDFIEFMHSKVNELRARADETARTIQCHQQQGLDPPPNLDRHFETLLLTVGKLYSNDKMNLNLDLEYWGPMEVSGNYHHHQRTSNRSVSLFKFIRLAGELLPPILLIPYLKMLAGLSSCQQSARNAFNLLKQGSNISGSTTLSWEHFFGSISRYYTTLRQEQHPATDTVYRSRALNRNISPQELAGLQAVLAVIRAVATHDDVARIALCEHPSWAPLHILLGLVSCSIDISLKTDLLLTLAALGKSKETALQLWANLEASQIITTIQSTHAFSTVPRGIESEIDKTESRNETYPLTQAILELLYTLSSTVMPRNLGAGPRKPGIHPYFKFILESIFLKFYNRIYKDESEKWIVAEKCLIIFEFFVKSYEINPADFPVMGQNKDEYPPPGFDIMLEMNLNEKSELLKLLLHIIHEACSALDTYTNFAGKARLENCVFYSLNIIERSLSQQDRFFDAHYEAKCSILLSGLNKLLLGINYRSGKPDHMLNVVKFVTYNSWLPKQALLAVRILSHVTRQPGVHTLLLSEFTRTNKLANEIRHGFVECLESDLPAFLDNEDIENAIENGDEIELTIKEEIIKLIEECLPHSAPNVSHYLLGFDITKDVRSTLLQQPGVLDFPSNCTKSLITILDEGIQQMKFGIEIPFNQQRLLQNGYHLLYTLCSNHKTSEVILRFLRECKEFLLRHIAVLPFQHCDHSPLVLNQMTGLLKCVAIELKLTANHQQVKQFKNLTDVLLGTVKTESSTDTSMQPDATHGYSIGGGGVNTTMFSMADNSMLGRSFINSYRTLSNENDNRTDLLICKLLECLEFDIKQLDRPKWDFFDDSLMNQLFQNCIVPPESNVGGGPKLINIKKLHDILKDELNIVQSTIATGQRQLILHEIDLVLKYAVDLNAQKNRCASTVRFMEAWSQVTEILFAVAPIFALCYEDRGGFIIEILQALLNKVVQVDVMPELGRLASSTLLQMLVCLRHWYKNSNVTFDSNGLALSRSFTANQSLTNGSTLNMATNNLTLTPKINTLSLKYILKNIVDWIIISGEASQKLKMNLYASLLNFMHIVKGHNTKDSLFDDQKSDHYISRLDRSMARATGEVSSKFNLTQLAVEVFNSVGDKVVDILCHDCTGGHDVCKMLALSCIDMLLDIDSMVNFIQFISRRGYLAHLVDSLLKTDDQLCRVLESTPENMKALYVYESKMAMLGRVASSYVGAELLLEHRLLGILSGMKVYDMHPDFQVNNYMSTQYSQFVPPVDIRYQQVLFPALNLCDIILSTLGPENYSAITQVVHFLLSHGDMIEIVLRAGTPFLNIGLLQELAAITGLIARSANQDISNLIEPNTNQDLGAHLYRLQKLMLNLFPRFIVTESTLKEMSKTNLIAHESQLNMSRSFSINTNLTYTPDNQQKAKTLQIKYFLQIACNLALYARNAIANHSADHRSTGILFSPTFSEGLQRNEIRTGTLETSPSLGIVVSQLKNCVEYYNREKGAYDSLLRQRKALEASLNINHRDQQQYETLSEKLLNKQDELKYCIFLTENCLYLLWAHLDFFMLRAISVNPLQFNKTLSKTYDSPITSSIDAGWKVTAEDVSNLKKTLIQVFTETFCKQLIATTQDQTSTDKSFVEALLRRIKHLIQFVPVK